MTEELNKLAKTFAEEPVIKASNEAKQAAISAAMSAFEEEKTEARQGKLIENRHKEQDNNNVVVSTFSKWRESMKFKYVLPGAAALATITLVAVNTYQFQPLFSGDEVRYPKDQGQVDDLKAMESSLRKIESGVRSDESLAPQAAPAAGLSYKQNVVPELESDTDSYALVRERKRAKQMLVMQEQAKNKAKALKPTAIPRNLAQSGDRFETVKTNPLKLAAQEPVSTFSIDVDTASYSYMRASLNRGVMPVSDTVRVEELINYFPYDYPAPVQKQTPFQLNTTVMPNPWNEHTKLLHVGIKGYDLPGDTRPRSNLVFLLDVSGSMNEPNKLPLLKNSFKLLLSSLAPDDTVSIVAYAGNAGTVLEPTKVKNQAAILKALSGVEAGGSTAGGQGIELAYNLAEQNFDAAAVNRVILATDGDFNVGISDPEDLKRLVERKRKSGIFLSVLGFGTGNYNDELMQALAQNGNGNAAYIDSLSEARKVLLEEASSTLFTIAKDVKIQIEFNPDAVSEYRLIGYETRHLNREDFNNDTVDAGDIGAGHTVTAIYEITPAGSVAGLVDDLRYQPSEKRLSLRPQTEYGFLKLRYKLPDEDVSKLVSQAIRIDEAMDDIKFSSDDARFATAVAAYGQLLRGGTYTGSYSYDDIIALAMNAKGQDAFGYRSEFINLVRLAKSIDTF
jgi:Ca-activated chloride channel family protein